MEGRARLLRYVLPPITPIHVRPAVHLECYDNNSGCSSRSLDHLSSTPTEHRECRVFSAVHCLTRVAAHAKTTPPINDERRQIMAYANRRDGQIRLVPASRDRRRHFRSRYVDAATGFTEPRQSRLLKARDTVVSQTSTSNRAVPLARVRDCTIPVEGPDR